MDGCGLSNATERAALANMIHYFPLMSRQHPVLTLEVQEENSRPSGGICEGGPR